MYKCIAWIEDDIDVIDAVVKPLRDEGFTILEIRSYSDAIDRLEEIRDCGLVLLDLILPPGQSDKESEKEEELLGLELLKEMRRQGIVVPVIMFSVVAHQTGLRLSELESLDAVPISKPVRPSVLRDEVHRLLEMRS